MNEEQILSLRYGDSLCVTDERSGLDKGSIIIFGGWFEEYTSIVPAHFVSIIDIEYLSIGGYVDFDNILSS